jgi:uncharacterized protein YdeI (BOF family)
MFPKIRSKWWITLSVIILGIAMVSHQNNVTYAENIKEDGLLLIKTLKKAEVEVNKIALNYSGLVSDQEDSKGVHHFKQKVEEAFSLELSQIKHPNHESQIKYQGKKTLSTNPSTQLQVNWVGVKDDTVSNSDTYKTYLVVSLSSEIQKQEEYLKNYSILKDALRSLSIDPKIKVNIQGTIDKKLTHDDQQERIMSMYHQLNANVLEGLNEEEVISLTGFSNQLSYSITSNGKPINLQVASRYDALKDKTTFTIGTPVITIEY